MSKKVFCEDHPRATPIFCGETIGITDLRSGGDPVVSPSSGHDGSDDTSVRCNGANCPECGKTLLPHASWCSES